MALILASTGAREALIQGALLHDVVEDCDEWSAERLRDEFGDDVADIVADLTEDKSKSWEERKNWALEHVPHMSDDSVTVKAADKLHNLESLAISLNQATSTDEVWAKFNGGREKTIEKDARLVDALANRVGGVLGDELRAAFARVQRDA
jgi:guanosine-3',5'-bis(diphosphate) 3'-pyrophosphohydrolase